MAPPAKTATTAPDPEPVDEPLEEPEDDDRPTYEEYVAETEQQQRFLKHLVATFIEPMVEGFDLDKELGWMREFEETEGEGDEAKQVTRIDWRPTTALQTVMDEIAGTVVADPSPEPEPEPKPEPVQEPRARLPFRAPAGTKTREAPEAPKTLADMTPQERAGDYARVLAEARAAGGTLPAVATQTP